MSDWLKLTNLLAKGHPIFDESLASESLAAIQTVRARLLEALQPVPQVAAYLRTTVERSAVSGGEERIYAFDVGSHINANWPRGHSISRIAILLIRPGVATPASDTQRDEVVASFQAPDYREVFPALDLELRFEIGTSDEAVRQAAVSAVKEALAGLRAAEARAAR